MYIENEKYVLRDNNSFGSVVLFEKNKLGKKKYLFGFEYDLAFEGDELRFEANIFDFSKDIYGDTIKIYWLDKIRDMVKFDGIESLLNQLKSDEVIARAWKA